MNKETFYNILTEYTPEELNNFISKKGKKKMTNAIGFIKNSSVSVKKEGNNENGKS